MRIIKAWSDRAWGDYLYWQKTDLKKVAKINELLKAIERKDAARLGKTEILKGLNGYRSAHIDKKNRLVYLLEDDTIKIAQCKGHYDDK